MPWPPSPGAEPVRKYSVDSARIGGIIESERVQKLESRATALARGREEMSAKRYFQLSYIWPVALPVAILALPGHLLPDWISQFCRGVLHWAGIPCAVFAAVMILWSRNKEAHSIRRSTYISPPLILPAIAMYLVMAGGMTAKTYSSDPAAAIFALFIYGFAVLTSVLALGYTYVGLINLVFVILRSFGAFEEDEWFATTSEDPYFNLGAPTWPSRQASYNQSTGGPVQPASDRVVAGSPYCFVSWEHERSKGSSTAHAASNSEAPATSSPEPSPMPDQTARSSRPAPLSGQPVRSSEAVDGFALPAPGLRTVNMPNPGGHTATGRTPVSRGLYPEYKASSYPTLEEK